MTSRHRPLLAVSVAPPRSPCLAAPLHRHRLRSKPMRQLTEQVRTNPQQNLHALLSAILLGSCGIYVAACCRASIRDHGTARGVGLYPIVDGLQEFIPQLRGSGRAALHLLLSSERWRKLIQESFFGRSPSSGQTNGEANPTLVESSVCRVIMEQHLPLHPNTLHALCCPPFKLSLPSIASN